MATTPPSSASRATSTNVSSISRSNNIHRVVNNLDRPVQVQNVTRTRKVSQDETYSSGVSELFMANSIDRWFALSTSTNPTNPSQSEPQSEDSIHLVQMNALHNCFEYTYSTLDPFLGGYVEDHSDMNQMYPRIGLVSNTAAADEILYSESLNSLRDFMIWELETTEWMFNRSTQNKL